MWGGRVTLRIDVLNLWCVEQFPVTVMRRPHRSPRPMHVENARGQRDIVVDIEEIAHELVVADALKIHD